MLAQVGDENSSHEQIRSKSISKTMGIMDLTLRIIVCDAGQIGSRCQKDI